MRDELLPDAIAAGDAWLCCVGQLLLGDSAQAIAALASSPNSEHSSALEEVATDEAAASGLRQGGFFEPCTAAFCVHVAANPKRRLAATPLSPKLLLRCTYTLGRRGCLLLAIEALRGGKLDRPTAGHGFRPGDDTPQRLMCALVCRYLTDRAIGMVGVELSRAPSIDAFAQTAGGAMTTLRDEATLLSADCAVSMETVRAYAEVEATTLLSAIDVLPRIAMLGCLGLWQPCTHALRAAMHETSAVLCAQLPHELPQSACSLLARSTPTLSASCELLLAEGALSEHDELRRRATQLVRRAEYALRCSMRDFPAVFRMLRSVSGDGMLGEASVGVTCPSPTTPAKASHEERYVWARFHLCSLQYVHRLEAAAAAVAAPVLMDSDADAGGADGAGPRVRAPPALSLQNAAAESRPLTALSPLDTDDAVLIEWTLRLRQASREAASHICESSFPLEPTVTLTSRKEQQQALSAAWALVSGVRDQGTTIANASTPAPAATLAAASASTDPPDSATLADAPSAASPAASPAAAPAAVEAATPLPPSATLSAATPRAEPLGIWPLAHELTKPFIPPPKAIPQPVTRRGLGRSAEIALSAPIELFSRRGDFVRAVCVNALNSCQLAISLAHGVHQLELFDAAPPTGGEPDAAARAVSGGGSGNGGEGGEAAWIGVEQSSASDFNARCLCAHPKLPLYLAGGDSVVQCWQFGQTIQGQGLHDTLRAQYKLPTGGKVANLRISPECEWFSSIDQGGYLCLWRFQSGSDMPLPFSRLLCHNKRGSDLCFVRSSVVLATVGASQGNDAGGSISLWDVLLPPAQARVATCADAHSDGARCVLHCAADASLISGGERGEMAIFDLRMQKLREKWTAHSQAVQALALADDRRIFSTSADSDMKLWAVDAPLAPPPDSEGSGVGCAEGQPRGMWERAHEAQTIFAPLAGSGKLGHNGVTALTTMPGGGGDVLSGSSGRLDSRLAGLISGGADGKVKLWRTV